MDMAAIAPSLDPLLWALGESPGILGCSAHCPGFIYKLPLYSPGINDLFKVK